MASIFWPFLELQAPYATKKKKFVLRHFRRIALGMPAPPFCLCLGHRSRCEPVPQAWQFTAQHGNVNQSGCWLMHLIVNYSSQMWAQSCWLCEKSEGRRNSSTCYLVLYRLRRFLIFSHWDCLLTGTIILKPITKQELCFVQDSHWSMCHTNTECCRLGLGRTGQMRGKEQQKEKVIL